MSGDISNGTTWTDGNVYRITGDAHVPAGATLTIQAGAIVKFNEFASLDLLIDGTVNANGTAAKHILFTSMRDDTGLDGILNTGDDNDTNQNGTSSAGPGEWNHISVSATGTASLNNVDIRSGGSVAAGVVSSLMVNGGALTLTNSVVQKSQQAGVRMVSANPTITGNIFRDSVGAAISMDLESNPAITGFTATNNVFNGLLVDSGTISGSRQWNDPDIVYVLSGDVTVAQGATLTIAPGQVIKVRDFIGNALTVNGTLNADGTPTQKILFASFRDDRGFDLVSATDDQDTNNNGTSSAGVGEWDGIVFNAMSTANVLDNVEVRSAGDSAVAAAIIVNSAPLTLTNSIARESETHGVRINAADPTLTGNSFIGNAAAAVSMDLASNPVITGFTATGNRFNGLLVDSGTISGSRQWNDPDAVYVLDGDVTVAQGATLTIAPGQVMKVRDFIGNALTVNGTLIADGTATQKILFASFRDDRGFDLLNAADDHDTNNNGTSNAGLGEWDGIVFNATSTANVLDNVEVRSAGDSAVAAAIIVNSAPLRLTNSIVRESETHGVRINTADPTLTGNSFIGGQSGAAISMDLASNPVITGFAATGNRFNGLLVDSGTISGSRQWNDPDAVYILDGDVTVAQGATLTIAPGQVIKVRDFLGNALTVNGTLNADGTSTQKILFASFRDDRGFDLLNATDDHDTNNNGTSSAGLGEWDGIVFNATSTANVLDNVEVRSAGDSAVAAAIIVNSAPLTMTKASSATPRRTACGSLRLIRP